MIISKIIFNIIIKRCSLIGIEKDIYYLIFFGIQFISVLNSLANSVISKLKSYLLPLWKTTGICLEWFNAQNLCAASKYSPE